MHWPVRLALVAVLALLSTAGAVEGPRPDPDLALLPASAFTRVHAAHLLRRAGFGGTPSQIDALHARGIDGAVDWLVDFHRTPDPLPKFAFRHTGPPPRREMVELTREQRRERFRAWRRDDVWQLQQAKAWWLDRMVRTPRPLQERLTLFWHGHFCSGFRDVRNSFQMFLQNQQLRYHAAGNFRTLLRTIARDPAMLEYLDNRVNRREHPNENFAREVMELFVLGIGNYTEEDIKEAARAFTGWTSAGNRFLFRERWHDPGTKTVLGQTGAFDGDALLDILLAQPCAAEHIAGKLFRYFAHDAPTADVVRGLAATLRGAGWKLRPVLKQLFRSRAFYGAKSIGARIKSPVEMVVSLCRTMGVTRVPEGVGIVLCGGTTQLGQQLFEPPNVKGWAGGRDWISTSTLLGRYNLAAGLVASPREIRAFTERAERRLRRRAQRALRDVGLEGPAPAIELSGWQAFDVFAALEGCETVEEKVDRLCARFLAVPAPATLRRELVEYLNVVPDGLERLHGLLRLLVSTPEFQLS